MDKKLIEVKAFPEQWKNDRTMVALFDVMEDIGETNPVLNEMIEKRAQEVFAKLQEASYNAFLKSRTYIFEPSDEQEVEDRLEEVIHDEFRKLTDDEQEILMCTIEFHESPECWTWYEWNIFSGLLLKRGKHL